MSTFDWCLRSQHTECTTKYQRFIIEPQKKRGKPPNKITYLDDWRECECKCHSNEPVVEKSKPKPRKRKK